MRIESEAQLIGLAQALIGSDARLTEAEKRLVAKADPAPPTLIDYTIEAIRAGEDPLGTAFCNLRPADERRTSGATYTPPAIVEAMVAWAQRQSAKPMRVVDPGAGSGRFLLAAARAFPAATLVAVEIDPLALLMLRANAATLGFSDRLTVKATDFRRIRLPRVKGPTLYIGNPPYVRHHEIGERWKRWFATKAADLGISASKLAGLHIHFFLQTRLLGQEGDFGTYITAAEWIDVNYGSALREMLSGGLGGASLHVLSPALRPFSDALVSGAITCFQVGARPSHLTINSIESLDELEDLSGGSAVEWSALASARRWSIHVRQGPTPPAGHIEVGELFRVHRGQVTGANAVWIAGPLAEDLPARLLFPSITKARELLSAGGILSSLTGLKSVIDLPVDLSELDPIERKAVDRYMAWAKKLGAQKGYIARNRRAWWSVGLKEPAPILCTYMARRTPAFVRNLAGAHHLNIAHGLYPREPMDEQTIARVLTYLSANVALESGRTYGGGLTKFEPGEVERLTMPALHELTEAAA